MSPDTQAEPALCPHCGDPLGMSSDMWGRFYLCQECGFTEENDDPLRASDPGLATIIGDELPPELKRRVRTLVADLARDDLPMALLDLAQLHRALTGIASESDRAKPAGAPAEAAGAPTLIYDREGTMIEERCTGPEPTGRCPRAGPGCPVACAGRWILATGWNFKVAADATSCPLAFLGLVPPQPLASAA